VDRIGQALEHFMEQAQPSMTVNVQNVHNTTNVRRTTRITNVRNQMLNIFGGTNPEDPIGVAATTPDPPGPPPPPAGAVKRALTDAANTQPHKYQALPAGTEARSSEAKLQNKMARAKAAAKPLPGAPAAKALPAAPPTAPTVTPAKAERYDIGSPTSKVRNPAPVKKPPRNAKGIPDKPKEEAVKGVLKNTKQTTRATKAEPRSANRKGARSFAIVPAT
jgi:hypothetical protein